MKSFRSIVKASLLFAVMQGACGPVNDPVTRGQNVRDDVYPGNLFYHLGSILTAPRVYVVFWGPEWAGFGSSPHGSFEAIRYLVVFLENVVGSDWLGTQTQYCQKVDLTMLGADTCPADADFFTNAPTAFGGFWIDSATGPPSPVTKDALRNEAEAVRDHFGDFDQHSIVVIATPPGYYDEKTTPGTPTACAWHSSAYASNGDGPYSYVFLPWAPGIVDGAGTSLCGTNAVNADDAFGRGYFDGYSIIAGHEVAESITDPFASGWFGTAGSSKGENGDLCAWRDLTNVGLADAALAWFPVQSLWSNRDRECVLGSFPLAVADPTVLDFGSSDIDVASAPQTVTVTNPGKADLVFLPSGFSTGGIDPKDFIIGPDNCKGLTLHPMPSGDSCTVRVSFRPSARGARNAFMVALTNTSGSPVSVSLSGIGTETFLILTPLPSHFHADIGSLDIKPVHIRNLSQTAMRIDAVGMSSPSQSFNVASDQCTGAQLPPGGTCVVAAAFSPHTTGPDSAQIQVQAAQRMFSTQLDGDGLGPALALSTHRIDFPPTPPGGSQTAAVQLSSSGQAPVLLQNVSATGAFTAQANCPQRLPPNALCTIDVRYSPTGPFNLGELRIVSNAGIAVVKLTGAQTPDDEQQ